MIFTLQAIRVWKLYTGDCLRVLQATEPVYCIKINKDMIIAGGEKAMHVWSRTTYRLQKSFAAHSKPPTNIVLWGPYIITSSNDRTVKVWQQNWACVRTIEHGTAVTGLDVAGDYIVSGDSSGLLSIRNVSSGRLERTIETRNSLFSLSVVQESNTLVCASLSGQIQVWEKEEFKM